jgi:CBS domain-containing protein
MATVVVRDLMTANPVCCTAQDRITDVARMMAEADCGALPVVESQQALHLCGMITDRDIVVRIVGRGLDPSGTMVQQAMSTDLVCIGPDAALEECVQLMAENQVRRIPVVDRDGLVLGILAQADLARASARQQELEEDLADMIEEVSEPASGRVSR